MYALRTAQTRPLPTHLKLSCPLTFAAVEGPAIQTASTAAAPPAVSDVSVVQTMDCSYGFVGLA